MRKIIFLFAGLILGILLLFQFSKYSLYNSSIQQELVLGIIAIVFFGLGIYLSKRPSKSNEDLSTAQVDYNKIKAFHISNREYDVLEGLAEKLTNKEIASKLFLSESTIKTHVSNLFQKLNAKNRGEVVEIAMENKLLIEHSESTSKLMP
jgi:DNA-binding NarL/FixJ family response regulator